VYFEIKNKIVFTTGTKDKQNKLSIKEEAK